jgi:hypothetical protein
MITPIKRITILEEYLSTHKPKILTPSNSLKQPLHKNLTTHLYLRKGLCWTFRWVLKIEVS